MPSQPENDPLDGIYDALDRGEVELALELAEAVLAEGEDPVARHLAGRALLELDQTEPAVEQLARAASADPDDPEFGAWHGWALFRAARFAEAAREVERALAADERLPEAHHVHGLVLERQGRRAEADAAFARAAALAPDWFPLPCRHTRASFDRCIETARGELEPTFREHLDRVAVLVEDLPPEALLFEERPPLDPELLGLFVGLPLALAGAGASGELPPRIYLFQRNLERWAEDEADLAEQIRITLYHELGHYLGMDEDDLEALGYD